MQPKSSACERLAIESSTKLAGRNIVVSISTPARPGFISSSAASTPRVTASVLPQGNLPTDHHHPRPIVDDPPPAPPGGPPPHLPHPPKQRRRAPAPRAGDPSRCLGCPPAGDEKWDPKGLVGVFENPAGPD